MTVTTALATFFLIWWVSAVRRLAVGRAQPAEGGEMAPGTDPGAPTNFRLGRKLLWTTLVAAVIYAGFYVVYSQHLVTLSDLTAPF